VFFISFFNYIEEGRPPVSVCVGSKASQALQQATKTPALLALSRSTWSFMKMERT